MKKTTTLLATLAAATSAFAHTSGVVHTHNDNSINWMTTLGIAVVFATLAFFQIRKRFGR
ncbi:hypothetical protein [Pelagicoccus albus]|uniref:LPXTG-motif cell wall anchor domain-containing protein n=1 Tax=Pelagicoccus albus TaxID=415222 RepID=A0A7X1B6N5_9BACT|nr:hypothetical protein [Pelagicoccus albus]MBC2606646.1 hypothetical protein [Pelagicoccus albus]